MDFVPYQIHYIIKKKVKHDGGVLAQEQEPTYLRLAVTELCTIKLTKLQSPYGSMKTKILLIDTIVGNKIEVLIYIPYWFQIESGIVVRLHS